MSSSSEVALPTASPAGVHCEKAPSDGAGGHWSNFATVAFEEFARDALLARRLGSRGLHDAALALRGLRALFRGLGRVRRRGAACTRSAACVVRFGEQLLDHG
ncbi:MAG: hypothetical protein ACK5C3_10115, partial [bacterium]